MSHILRDPKHPPRDAGDRPLIPHPYGSEAEYQRFWHLDIPGLSDEHLRAETREVINVLAHRLACHTRRRPIAPVLRALGCEPRVIDDETWLRERLRVLQTEARRRGQRPEPPPRRGPRAEPRPRPVRVGARR